jgi:hypothetical protein
MNDQQMPRKIIKVKKRVTIDEKARVDGELQTAVLVDEETGEAIEFEGEVEGENEHYIDEEDVVQNDDDDDEWQDEGDESDDEDEKPGQTK